MEKLQLLNSISLESDLSAQIHHFCIFKDRRCSSVFPRSSWVPSLSSWACAGEVMKTLSSFLPNIVIIFV